MILAKPTLDISLEEHTANVVKETEAILASWPYLSEKYNLLTGKDLSKRVVTAAKYHDLGKKHPRWQEPCQKDHKIFKETGQENKMFHLRNANFRHEIASLLEPQLHELSEPVKAAIAAHHGKLAESAAHRWEEQSPKSAELWSFFKGVKNRITRIAETKLTKLEKTILARYEFAGPRCLLQLADHRASAFETGQKLPVWKPFDYTFPFEQKRGVQLLLDEFKDQPFAILRAPTGSGKTDTALLWSKYQIEMKRADRLVIAMPTRFTANALSISVSKNLSQTGLYHSSAWFEKIKNKTALTNLERNLIVKEQTLARVLATPITVTTIDHLCICLTGTREDHHAIFFNLAHSCVVIDESDFYDVFTQMNMVVLLKVLSLLKVPVLLMSATVPDSSLKFYSLSGNQINNVIEDRSDSERIRYSITRIGPVAAPADCAKVLEMGFEKPLIIYANTVARAQAFYKWFLEKDQNFCEQNVILYHSRFTEPDKAKIENILSENLGSQAWKNGNQKGVAILTQIGELSVNISADIMITDLCPIDRLTQRAGRLARFSKSIGQMFVMDPFKEGILYPAPYGNYDRTGWIPTSAFLKSNEMLRDAHYSSSSLFKMVNEIYIADSLTLDDRAIINKDELENLCIDNWLILPADKIDEDDDETVSWKSRDIDAQYLVFVNFDLFEDSQYLPNRTALREFQILHGVQCYAHEFHLAKKKGFIEQATFIIGDDMKIPLWIAKRVYYDSKIGLHFD